MREPSLQRTTVLSLALHVSFFIISFILLRQSNQFIMPSSYTVSLISPEVLKSIERKEVLKSVTETLKETSLVEDISKRDMEKREEMKERVEEKISAIEAKKRIERIVRLRSIISLKASDKDRNDIPKTTSNYLGEGSVFDSYYAKIRKQIWKQWIFPDTGQENLEAIISIKIRKDGAIITQKIEKSSGNSLFDRSVIKALSKASPLLPPPYEMEIGVRFYL